MHVTYSHAHTLLELPEHVLQDAMLDSTMRTDHICTCIPNLQTFFWLLRKCDVSEKGLFSNKNPSENLEHPILLTIHKVLCNS